MMESLMRVSSGCVLASEAQSFRVEPCGEAEVGISELPVRMNPRVRTAVPTVPDLLQVEPCVRSRSRAGDVVVDLVWSPVRAHPEADQVVAVGTAVPPVVPDVAIWTPEVTVVTQVVGPRGEHLLTIQVATVRQSAGPACTVLLLVLPVLVPALEFCHEVDDELCVGPHGDRIEHRLVFGLVVLACDLLELSDGQSSILHRVAGERALGRDAPAEEDEAGDQNQQNHAQAAGAHLQGQGTCAHGLDPPLKRVEYLCKTTPHKSVLGSRCSPEEG